MSDIIWMVCPECGHKQPDMGNAVACEECGGGPWDYHCWKLDEIDRKWDIPGSLR